MVAFNHGGAIESIINNSTGILVEPKNEKELGFAIEKLINISTTQRNKMAKISRNHIVKNFSLDKMTNKTLDLYMKLLGTD